MFVSLKYYFNVNFIKQTQRVYKTQTTPNKLYNIIIVIVQVRVYSDIKVKVVISGNAERLLEFE